MSMFPDCRQQYTRDAYRHYGGDRFRKMQDIPPDEVSPYWQGHLKGENRQRTAGYDYCAEQVKLFFSNTDVYEEELGEALGDRKFWDKLDPDVIEDERSINEFTLEERKTWSRPTLIFKTIQDCMLDFIEMTRNESIVAMLDEQEKQE